MSLVAHLMRKRGIGYPKALLIAQAIEARRKSDAADRKAGKLRLERAQGLLDFDGAGAAEEPADRFVQTDPTVDF